MKDRAGSVFPVSHSTLDADALAAELPRRYALAEPVRCRLISRRASDIYSVETPDRRYALRVMRARYRTEAELDYEIGLLRHLDAQGLAVATPVLTREGAASFTLEAPEGPRPITLGAWLEGVVDESEPSEDMARALGGLVARLHRIAAEFTHPTPKRLDPARRIAEKWPPLAARVAGSDAQALYDRAHAALPRLIAATGDLPRGTTHGDLHHGNAMRLADGRLAALDFDECADDVLARDLTPFRWRFDIEGYAPELWPAFLAGYETERKLTEAERAALPALIAIRHIYIAAVYATYIDKIGPVPGWGSNLSGINRCVAQALDATDL